MSIDNIERFVRLVIEEGRRVREADMTGGRKAPWGSEEHIKDLEARMADLTRWRDAQRRGSESRANYARIVQKLRGELASARKASEKQKKPDVRKQMRAIRSADAKLRRKA